MSPDTRVPSSLGKLFPSPSRMISFVTPDRWTADTFRGERKQLVIQPSSNNGINNSHRCICMRGLWAIGAGASPLELTAVSPKCRISLETYPCPQPPASKSWHEKSWRSAQAPKRKTWTARSKWRTLRTLRIACHEHRHRIALEPWAFPVTCAATSSWSGVASLACLSQSPRLGL